MTTIKTIYSHIKRAFNAKYDFRKRPEGNKEILLSVILYYGILLGFLLSGNYKFIHFAIAPFFVAQLLKAMKVSCYVITTPFARSKVTIITEYITFVSNVGFVGFGSTLLIASVFI